MPQKFLETALTGPVRDAQKHYYGRARELTATSSRDVLGEEEIRFIQERDSFYMATVSESGWPYIQHRGGTPGFLRVRGQNALGFADYKGNRQFISTGNLATNNRVALFLTDYPKQWRLRMHVSIPNW